jgi:hypothetical protein
VDLTFKEFFVNDAFGSDELFPPLQGGFPGPIDVGPEGVDPNQGDFPNVGDIFA